MGGDMTGVTELGYARFGVADLAEWRDFAETILGLEVCDSPDEGRVYLRADYWHHRIILDQNSSDDLLAAGLRVAGTDELKDVAQLLERAGVDYEKGSDSLCADRKVLELIVLDDPAGNPLEIFHGPRIESHLPFLPSRRLHGRFVMGPGGLGHMILKQVETEKMFEFYKMLGMRGGIEYKFPLPNGQDAEVLFMHCNERDHTLAFAGPNKKYINHLMLEFDNLDDVFVTQDLVEASDYSIALSLGKHANDHMISFYFETPSGWLIEIGSQGRPATHQSEYYIQDTYGHKRVGQSLIEGGGDLS